MIFFICLILNLRKQGLCSFCTCLCFV